MKKVVTNHVASMIHASVRLQKSAMTLMTFLVLLTFLMTNMQALFWQSSDWLVAAVLPGVVASLTNNERTKYAVPSLSRSAVLDEAARLKAEHMAAEGYFSHNSPGGITPWFWFEQAGYVYAHAGENLAVHFNDSAEVVNAWMESPTHKANVIGAQYTEIGIGTAKGRYKGQATVFVVQLFGTPAQRPVVVAPEPPAPATVVSDILTTDSEASPVPPVAVAPVSVATPLTIATTEEAISDADALLNTEQTSLIAGDTTAVVTTPQRTVDESPVVPPPSPTLFATNDREVPTVTIINTDGAILYDSFVATSSGLLPNNIGNEFVAGTTAPTVAILATQPRTVVQGIYLILGSVVITLLLISIVMGYRAHRPKSIVTGVALLLVMSFLFTWHIAITGGALIA